MLYARLYSYKRKLIYALGLVLAMLGLSCISLYRNTQKYTRYVSAGKPILTGQTEQTYSQIESYTLPCVYVSDDTLYEDECITVQEGAAGTREITILSTYYNGAAMNHEILDTRILTEATPKIIHIGTKERPYYALPMSGYKISSRFGYRWGRTHEGIDLAAPTGTDVCASADGTVTRAETYGGYGLCVDIAHANGSVTRYGHLSKILVSEGDRISQGDRIGLSGNTGRSTGPHLHFEIRINDSAVNPEGYLSF